MVLFIGLDGVNVLAKALIHDTFVFKLTFKMFENSNSSKINQKTTRALSLYFLLVFVILFFYIGDSFSLYPVSWIYGSAVFFVIALLFVCALLFFIIDGFSLALVFLSSYAIFIGGRIFVFIFNEDLRIFDFSYFYNYSPSNEDILRLVLQSIVGFLTVVFGYLVAYTRINCKGTIEKYENIDESTGRLTAWLLIAAVPILSIELFNVVGVIREQGYAAIYLGQTESYTGSFLSFGLTLITLSVCFGLRLKKSFLRTIVMMTYAFVCVILGVVGQRGVLLSLIFLITALSFENKNKLQKIVHAFLALSMVVLVLWLFSIFSFREYELESNYGSKFFDFLYEQGGTLPIFGMSLEVTDYPLSAYIQNFVPGFAVVSNWFGNPIAVDQLSFGAFFSKNINESLFDVGQGLGWSVLGDATLFFGYGYPVYFLLLGWFLGCVDIKKKEGGGLFFGIWILLLIKIPFLPRANIGSVIIPILYFVFVWMVFQIYLKHKFLKLSK